MTTNTFGSYVIYSADLLPDFSDSEIEAFAEAVRNALPGWEVVIQHHTTGACGGFRPIDGPSQNIEAERAIVDAIWERGDWHQHE